MSWDILVNPPGFPASTMLLLRRPGGRTSATRRVRCSATAGVLTVECNPTYPMASQRYIPAAGAWVRRWRKARADDPVAYVRKVMVNTHLTRWRRWGGRIRLGEYPRPPLTMPG